MKDLLPPCIHACPVNTDVRGYLAAIARQDYDEAYRLIRANNPFPAVCAWICPHPCEEHCRRGDVDASIAIRNLKRFAVENAGIDCVDVPAVPGTGKNIAVVGAGPGGLTAAYDLARLGHNVTVYERNQTPGGHFFASLPLYRLPREKLRQDIKAILAAGIKIQTGVEIGRDVTVRELKAAYDAVVLAVGLQESRTLSVPGADHPGILKALPFLQQVNRGEKPAIGGRVLVVGGGDVAMDAARTAVRLGAAEVNVICLETRAEMPAQSWEIEEALEEGVGLINGYGPREVVSDGDQILGLRTQKVRSVFDASGKFNPVFEPDALLTRPCDTIILAIGQGPGREFIKDSGLAIDARGFIVIDQESLHTSVEGVFACGEIAEGPGLAIAAIASGHKAAAVVNSYLAGSKCLTPAGDVASIGALSGTVAEKLPGLPRAVMPVLPAAVRRRSLCPYELGLDEEKAVYEAGRCLSCGLGARVVEDKCVACLSCQRVCPYEVPLIGGFARMPVETCQACGICAAHCPAYAIAVENINEQGIKETLAGLSGQEPLVIFTGQENYVELLKLNSFNAVIIRLPTVSALQLEWILSAFENGAGGVAVLGAGENFRRHLDDAGAVKGMLSRAKALLAAIGLDPARLYYCETPTAEETVAALEAFEGQIQRASAKGVGQP
jgi:formate dehydrogenase beta subunit